MTYDETEIVANAGVQLREIAERITIPASTPPRLLDVMALLSLLDGAALSISEVYGALSTLPIENEEHDFYHDADGIARKGRAA